MTQLAIFLVATRGSCARTAVESWAQGHLGAEAHRVARVASAQLFPGAFLYIATIINH